MIRISTLCMLCVLLLNDNVRAIDNETVKAELGKTEAWTGEGNELIITLYSPGPFSGTASFDLPELPRTAILKLGSPVVGSETIDGDTYFTQRHAFAVFTQQSGVVTIPSFKIRFQGKQSFVGDAQRWKGSRLNLHSTPIVLQELKSWEL